MHLPHVRRTIHELNRRLRIEAAVRGRKRFRSTVKRSCGPYAVLSLDPPIFFVHHWLDEEVRFAESMDQLFDYLRHRRAYFLYAWMWRIEDPARVAIVERLEHRHRRRCPQHRFVHLANTRNQEAVFAGHGLDTIFCSLSAFIDERLFRPLPGVEKRFDAVYDARLTRYKRHELAARIESLALICEVDEASTEPGVADATRTMLAHAHLYNDEGSEAWRRLSAIEVNQCLNECRVGLCLSAVEGAMYASIQYLLAGLPVVSTRSLGGRDVFFDDDIGLIVADDPEEVRAGVAQMISRRIAPELIRSRTLERIMIHRETLIMAVQRIYDAEGVKRRFADEWPLVYCNKLLGRVPHADTIARLEAVARNR